MAGHEGHRQRMRKGFLRHGPEGFEDHHLLELLLFYAQPRQDTNELAHRLIDHFGSLAGVFEASPEALMAVKDVGEAATSLIRLVPELGRRYLLSKQTDIEVLDSVEASAEYLVPRFMNCRQETVYLICLDAGGRILDGRFVGSGSLTSVMLDIRRILQTAVMMNARYVILAHNHTSGSALPSPEDRMETLRLRDALDLVGIGLRDHIIVAGQQYVSLAGEGFLKG